MRLATTLSSTGSTAVRVDAEICTPIAGCRDVGELLADPDWQERASAAAGGTFPIDSARFAPVVTAPTKILCTGLNFRGHIEEMGRALPEHPTLFAKFADTLTGPYDDIAAAPEDHQLDWEGELAVVIGRTAYRVSEEDAASHVAGFAVANDISMRGWQNRTQEWLQGKAWARSTPLGPWLTTPDEFVSATAVLCTTVNGEVRQKHALSDLLFTPEELIAYVSTFVPLRPGDVILTGTPGGVGHARRPSLYLTPGDRVEVTIDGLGTVSNLITPPDRRLEEHVPTLWS